jgi:Uma2 family endonuclease
MLCPMNVALPRSLNVDQYLAWAERQEQGKYELIDGVVIMQQSQQWGHAKIKFAVARALDDAIRQTKVGCYVGADGPTVRVNESTAFVPDALVAPLPEPALASLEIPNPTIVVEVLSPSTARIDATTKLRGYFEVASVQHYLILDPEDRTVTHHKRGAGDVIETRVLSEGIIALDPPGIEIRSSDLFAPAHT